MFLSAVRGERHTAGTKGELERLRAGCLSGSQYLHTKGSRHLGQSLCGAVPREFRPSQERGFQPFMLLWPVYPPQRGQSTGRNLNPAFEQRMLRTQGPATCGIRVSAAALPTGADLNPTWRTKLLLLESYLRLKAGEVLWDIVIGITEMLSTLFPGYF